MTVKEMRSLWVIEAKTEQEIISAVAPSLLQTLP
jgi:hypothetical protein